jgi:hypothetical protein
MFATVEPSGHVVAGDLPQSAVVDGDLGQERSDAGQPGEGGAPRTSPPPRGASRSTSIQTCRPERARDAGPGAGRSDEGRLAENGDPMPPL